MFCDLFRKTILYPPSRAHRWRGSTARTGNLFRADEPRQHPPAHRKNSLHRRFTSSAHRLACLERSGWCSDFLRRLGLPDYIHSASALGRTLPDQPARFLPDALARIAPLLILLLAVLTTLHFGRFQDFIVSAKTGGISRALLAALTFHVNVLEARHGYLPGNWDILWSLSVEEMFYLFFPIVSRLFARGKLLVLLLAIFVALGPFARTLPANSNELWKQYSYLGGMDAIALGCLAALTVARFPLSTRALRGLAIVGSALLIFILCFAAQPANMALERCRLAMTILALGTCMLITAAFRSNWKSPGILWPLAQPVSAVTRCTLLICSSSSRSSFSSFPPAHPCSPCRYFSSWSWWCLLALPRPSLAFIPNLSTISSAPVWRTVLSIRH
jgi:Acyltransferase family